MFKGLFPDDHMEIPIATKYVQNKFKNLIKTFIWNFHNEVPFFQVEQEFICPLQLNYKHTESNGVENKL